MKLDGKEQMRVEILEAFWDRVALTGLQPPPGASAEDWLAELATDDRDTALRQDCRRYLDDLRYLSSPVWA